MMDPDSIPSPLPALLQLLPFLLAESPCPIPASLLSDPVLQRHHYLPSSPDTHEYLQGYVVIPDVTEKLHQLAAQGVENVAPNKDVKYTAICDAENRLLASIKIAGWTGRKHALYVWLMWEDGQSGDSSSSAKAQLENAWRYYAIHDPSYKMDIKLWSDTIPKALAELRRIQTLAAAEEQELDDEDEDQAAARYWEGVSDEDEDDRQATSSSQKKQLANGADEDDAYWAGYGDQKSTIGGEVHSRSNGDTSASIASPLNSASSSQQARRKSVPSGRENADAATTQALQGVWNLYRQLKASHHRDDEESRAAFLELAKQATLDRD